MPQLVVPSFGGGVVLQGSPDTKKTDELLGCDAFDLSERGQLIASAAAGAYTQVNTGASPAIVRVHPGLTPNGKDATVVGPDFVTEVSRTGDTNLTTLYAVPAPSVNVPGDGVIVTVASVPYSAAPGSFTPNNPILVCFGYREFVSGAVANEVPNLYVFGTEGSPSVVQLANISQFDALGTGPWSEGFSGGTKGKALKFHGIVGYNNHIFGWGWLSATEPGNNRLMFSNTGKPLTWGNDNLGTSGDRDYTNSDAITIGAAGDRIRGCYAWGGKLWIATDKELHWLAGYGRDSFTTDGATIGFRENILGPHGMIEGPDGLLYGVGSNGLWVLDGSSIDVVGRRLTDFAGKSTGWWDLIWSDRTRGAGYPGVTNQDLVWLMSDKANKQVWVVIPFCNATLGYGYGTDTVVIKYHTLTGGFTRQVFANATYTAGCYMGQSASGPEVRLLGGLASGQSVVHRYGFKADASVSPALPTPLPSATFGPYAPYGPHGTGTHRVCYVTLGWESAASLPLVFTVTPAVDEQSGSAMKVSIQPTTPSTPSDGDYWLDTSGSDTNIGTATATALTPASADYVWKTYSASRARWIVLPHGGQKGFRATLRLAFRAMRGTRIKLAYTTTSAAGRFQIESLGLEPAAGREAA